MNSHRLALFSVLFAALLGAAFMLWRPLRVDSPQPASTEPAASGERPRAKEPPAPRPLEARQGETAPGREPEPEAGAPPPGSRTGIISMPIAEKLASEPLSGVPHALVGAWDEAPGSSRPGAHRTVVAVVDEWMPSREIERLVWDIRAHHRAAEVLDVRVYDSAEAATRSSALDGGVERRSHLVADVKRNDRLGFDQITVRGVVVGP